MSDMFQEIMEGKNKDGQSMKASEITGQRFLFHSLPKEFQDWHTTYFILEQRGELDSNIVSKAVFNGYMWKTIADASFYGFITGVALIAAILKLTFSPTLWGFIISLLIYLPCLFYVMYHFSFYAYIRAQVVGSVTEAGMKNTTLTFYSTFGAIVASILLAGVVSISFLDSIHELFGALINASKGDGITIFGNTYHIKNHVASAHATITTLLAPKTTILGKILGNEWITGIIFGGLTFGSIYFFEKEKYEKHKAKMDIEVKKSKASSGYPIESALDCLWEWRKKHGI